MNDPELSSEVSTSFESLKAWLATRPAPNAEETLNVSPPEVLKTIGFTDLILEKLRPCHRNAPIDCLELNSDSKAPPSWADFLHLTSWSSSFRESLEEHKLQLATLELVRGNHEIPISLAKHYVSEAINAVDGALDLALGLNLYYPDMHKGNNYGITNILIDDTNGVHEIVRQTFCRLYGKCCVRLVVKPNNFYSSILVAFLVDMMHKSGASPHEVSCFALDRRVGMASEGMAKPIASNRSSKLSVVAAVFKQTDTFAAAQGIIESYFRERYPSLIILVEELAYARFIKDWQRYYSFAVQIGPRLDNRTTIVDSFNSKVSIDLAAIDIKAAHKAPGNVISVIKFKSLSDIMSLLGSMRKIPQMLVWNDDVILAREFCLRVNACNEFWINHVPKSLAYHQLTTSMVRYFSDAISDHMTSVYNSIYSQYPDDVEQLRKTQGAFLKKQASLRSILINKTFTSILNKCPSLKNGLSIVECLSKLRRFHQTFTYRMDELESSVSRVEKLSKPVGLAILYARDEVKAKSKALLLELVFKNLLMGNGVLLVCPPNTFGVKFCFEDDHIIPFKMCHDSVPDISKLSLDTSIETNDTSLSSKKQCPKNSYAIELPSELTSDICDAFTIALGTVQRCIWFSSVDQTNYWKND